MLRAVATQPPQLGPKAEPGGKGGGACRWETPPLQLERARPGSLVRVLVLKQCYCGMKSSILVDYVRIGYWSGLGSGMSFSSFVCVSDLATYRKVFSVFTRCSSECW